MPRPEGTGSVLPDGWELPEGGSGRRGHVTKLPADLLTDSVWSIGGGETGCLGGIRGGAQGVRAHVCDGCGLSGRSGGGRCCGSTDLASGAPVSSPAADLFGDTKLALSEGSRPGDRLSGAAIPRGFRLEQPQHPLRAIRRPHGDDTPVGLAQRLRRAHTHMFPRASPHAAAPGDLDPVFRGPAPTSRAALPLPPRSPTAHRPPTRGAAAHGGARGESYNARARSGPRRRT